MKKRNVIECSSRWSRTWDDVSGTVTRLRNEEPRVESQQTKRFSPGQNVHKCSGFHKISYSKCTGILSRAKREGSEVNYLLPNLRISGAILLLPPPACWLMAWGLTPSKAGGNIYLPLRFKQLIFVGEYTRQQCLSSVSQDVATTIFRRAKLASPPPPTPAERRMKPRLRVMRRHIEFSFRLRKMKTETSLDTVAIGK